MRGIVFLPITDLEATRRFYGEILELRLALDQGGCLIYAVGTAYWGFCLRESGMADPATVCLTIVDDDVEGWHERLSFAGVPCDGAPRENPVYRIFHFFATDPNGYRLEVQRFLHPFG